MKQFFSVIVIVIVIVIPGLAFGHGLAITQQQTVGDYIVELEHDGTGPILAGQTTPYTFDLLHSQGEHVPYERAFVKITQQGEEAPLFAANLAPVDLLGRTSARASLTFANPGSYAVELEFYNGDTELAKTEFSFAVAGGPTQEPESGAAAGYAYVGFVLVLLSIIVVQFISLRASKKIK